MQLHTYLNYGGNCAQAFRFYEQHLGGKITFMMTHGEVPNPNPGPPGWDKATIAGGDVAPIRVVSDPYPTLHSVVVDSERNKVFMSDPNRHAWGMGRHFAGSNFYWYLRDPSGAFLELYSDLDRITDDAVWEQRGRTPLSLEHTVNTWGPNLPTEFVEPHDLAELEAGWATHM